jgi:LDH2 family malate/lactate/ureidoglycolate dehydrogenase
MTDTPSGTTYRILPFDELQDFTRAVFAAYGYGPADAAAIADVILRADLYGIESHGIQRLMRYHRAIRETKVVRVDAVPETVFETPISAVVDAQEMQGQLAAIRAMRLAIAKAGKSGIGMVAVRASSHFGIAGYYSRMAVEEDLLGVCMTNSEPILVPTFARKAMIGSNPIALGMPADPTPFLFDAATCVVPRGKLEVYAKRGTPLPEGWAIDETGAVCTDPQRVIDAITARRGGGILPLGGAGETMSGHKGYGFGLICDLFCSGFSGGPFSNHKKDDSAKSNTTHFFLAMDYGLFGGKADIRAHFSQFLQELRETPRAEGCPRVWIHGEKELESEARRRREGIPANDKTLAEMRRIAADLRLAAPW